MGRINIYDNIMSAITKMSDGNPGAITAMMELLTKTGQIDPYNAIGGFGNILLLDTYGIYGTDIYVLYGDICERDIAKMIAVLRATQMGMFNCYVLKDVCSRQDYSGKYVVPVDELCKQVKERLPLFLTDK